MLQLCGRAVVGAFEEVEHLDAFSLAVLPAGKCEQTQGSGCKRIGKGRLGQCAEFAQVGGERLESECLAFALELRAGLADNVTEVKLAAGKIAA